MSKYGIKVLLTVMICFGAIASKVIYADVLSIPDSEQSTDVDLVLPARGMSMDEVSNDFGNPLNVIDPVGTPPITRWTYENFTVVFEYQYVIHAVKNRKTKP